MKDNPCANLGVVIPSIDNIALMSNSVTNKARTR